MRNTSFFVIAALALLLAPCASLADGGYVEPTATTESDVAIEMVDQRALLWVGAEENELWLQNSYRGSAASVGWVIPIPHLPSVECSDDPLLDALDYETAPMFAERIWHCDSADGGFGCFFSSGDDAAAPVGESAADTRGGAAVTEWPVPIEGCPGMAVITTIDGDALVAWLSLHGYPVDASLAQLFLGYASRGWVFLVGEIAPDPETTRANTTLRIRWPRMPADPVVYPMALTGATAKIALDIRLYVAADDLYLPKNYPSSRVPPRLGEALHDAETYAEALAQTLDQPGGTWAIEYASGLFERYSDCPSGDESACADDEANEVGSPFGLATPEWLGDVWETSEPWAALTEGAPRITRLSATLSPAEMREDVVLEPALVESFEPTFLNEYACGDSPPEDEGEALALGRRLQLDPLLVLGLVGGVAFRRRQRRAGLALLALAVAVLAAGCGHDWVGTTAADPQTELCDGTDNDGDGRTDELWPLLGEACTSGVGACGVAGLWACTLAGDGVLCDGTPGQADDESCNGIDDDCDGVCDEGSACCQGTYAPCANACGHPGGAYCDDGCAALPCLADPPEQFLATALPYGSHWWITGEIDGLPGEEMVSIVSPGDAPALVVGNATGPLAERGLGYDGVGEPLWLLDQDGDGVKDVAALVADPGYYFGRFVGLALADDGLQELWRFVDPGGPAGPGATYALPTPQSWLAAVHVGGAEPAVLLVSRELDGSAGTVWILRGGLLADTGPLAIPAAYATSAHGAWVADFTGDGAEDLLIGPEEGADELPAGYLLFDQAALLEAAGSIAVSIYNGNRPAAFADLDHDGAAEILFDTMDEAENDFEVIDLPSGTSLGQLQLPGEVDYNYLYTHAGDFDGDGFDELVFTSIAEDDETGVHTYTFTIAEEPTVVDGIVQIGPRRDVVEALEQPGDIATMELDGRPGRDLLLQTPCSFGDCWEAVYSPAGCAIE